MVQQQGPFWDMYQELKSGGISRRQYIEHARGRGIATPLAAFVWNSLRIAPAAAAPPGGRDAFGARHQEGARRPAEGTEGQTRGAGGELKLFQWQGVTHF